MSIRIAAIEVSHWHSLHDSAYLRHLAGMREYELVGLQDPSAEIAARRAAALGNPPIFTDYGTMLAEVKPDFVIALGRHGAMAAIAHDLVDLGYPFLMEKPMGVNADEVRSVADKAAARNAFVAVPLGQRYQPFVVRARVARLLPPESAELRALSRVGRAVDARSRRRGRRMFAEPRAARTGSLLDADR